LLLTSLVPHVVKMTQEKLFRGIGRWDLTAMVINAMVGSGIFGLPSKLQALLGTYSLIAFILSAAVVGLIVLCYAEVSSRFVATGGPYLYAREAFGPVVGFEVGWLYWIVRVTTYAANCNLLITYFGFFVPSVTDGAPRLCAIGAVTLVIVVVNLIGIRESALMTNLTTAGKILPLVLFVAVGIFFIQPANFALGSVPESSAWAGALLLLVYTFAGFESTTIVAGEPKDPRRNMPFAILMSLVLVALLYITVQGVAIGTLPTLTTSDRPLTDAANGFMGSFGAALIAGAAIVSIFGNLNVGVLNSTRLLFAMGENRELPKVLGRIHPRYKTPYVSIILNGLIMLILTFQSSFLTALAIAVITRLVVYATTCLALPVFRFRTKSDSSALLIPFGFVISGLALVLIAWLLANVDFAKEGLPIIIFAVIGLALYGGSRFLEKDAVPQD